MPLKPHEIIEVICNKMNVTVDLVKSKSRLRESVIPRHFCVWFLIEAGLEETDAALQVNRDRTSIYHSVKNVKRLVNKNKEYKNIFFELRDLIEEGESDEDVLFNREIESCLDLIDNHS